MYCWIVKFDVSDTSLNWTKYGKIKEVRRIFQELGFTVENLPEYDPESLLSNFIIKHENEYAVAENKLSQPIFFDKMIIEKVTDCLENNRRSI
jgi:hypothetical protein